MTAFKMDQTAGLEILSNNDQSFNNYDAFLAQFAASAKNAKSPLLINLAKTNSTDEEQKTEHDHFKNEKPFSWLASKDGQKNNGAIQANRKVVESQDFLSRLENSAAK